MPAIQSELSRRPCIATLAILTVGMIIGSSGYSEDPVFSGPQPGEKLTSFKLMGVYDAAAGKEFDPIADADGKPTLLVFVHKITRPGLALTRGVTNYANSLKDVESFSAIAWLDDDKAKAEEFLTRARKSLNTQVPLGVSVDGGEGPGVYGLNRNVELTVLVAKDNKVVANFALIQPSMSDGVKIAGELAKVLGKEPPSEEELQKIAFPNRDMQMRRRPGGGQQRTRENPAGRERKNTKEEDKL